MIGFRRKRSGFTLIELLVVIAIIGVLAVLLMPAIRAARRTTREGATSAQVRTLKTSLQLFHNEWGELPNPTSLDGSDVIALWVNADFLDAGYRGGDTSVLDGAGSEDWVEVRVIYNDPEWDWEGGNCEATLVLHDSEFDLPELLYMIVATQFRAIDDNDDPVGAFYLDRDDDGLDPEEIIYAPTSNGSPYLELKGSQIGDLDGDGYPEILDAFGNPVLYSVGVRSPRTAEAWSMGVDGVVDEENDGDDNDDDGLIDEREDEINHVPELDDDITSW